MPSLIKITKEDDALLVSFTYHPKLVEQIKSLPPSARRWDQGRKVWVVQQHALGQLLDLFNGSSIEFHPRNLLELVSTVGASVHCLVCESAIYCEECDYADSCPAKNKTPYCICSDDLGTGNSWVRYSVAKDEFLALDTTR